MDNAPVTTGERLDWLALHCHSFQFQLNTQGYFIIARMSDDVFFESAGPVADMHEAIDDAFYEVLQKR